MSSEAERQSMQLNYGARIDVAGDRSAETVEKFPEAGTV